MESVRAVVVRRIDCPVAGCGFAEGAQKETLSQTQIGPLITCMMS